MAVTPYMSMDLPVVSATLGPAWASKINAALQLNDAHDHSTGKGVPVRPAGMYMDADLDFRGTNPKNMRSARFQLLSSLIGGVDDICCLYFKGADLYVNDSAGNQIQITSGGGIIGTPGSISGLVSPAAVTYTPASKIFNFYSDSLVRAAVGCGPLTIADPVTSGKGVTISVPSGLTGDYALELPGALPGSAKPLTLDATGKIAPSDMLTLVSTSGTAIAATGAGTGDGVHGVGGATSGEGLSGLGGSPDGSGVVGIGTGAGSGLGGQGGTTGPGATLIAGGGGSAVRGALNLGPQAAPSTPADGDIWVESGTNTLKVRINGATKTVTLT
jgi:hypothetical protein